MNPQSGLILSRIKTGRRPYRILFHPSGKMIYVSSWADGNIGEFDVNSGERATASFRVAPHPTDMLWVDGGLPAGASAGDEGQPEIKARLFVTAANTNSLYVFGASETGDLTKIDTFQSGPDADAAAGYDAERAGAKPGQEDCLCSVFGRERYSGDRYHGRAQSGEGLHSNPNLHIRRRYRRCRMARIVILNGRGNSLQLVDPPDDAKLQTYSDEVMTNFPYRDEMPETAPVPGQRSSV